MSELDIELQIQTADVSITEMMKEADDIQKSLEPIDKDTEYRSNKEQKNEI